MPSFYLLFLRGGKLIRSDRIDAESALDAAEEAARRAGEGHAELWGADGGKIATFRPRDTQAQP
jgi:hypothetical protein